MKRTMIVWAISLLATLQASAQEKELSGTVRDQQGNPVIGAAIRVLNTHAGTYTNEEGAFTLSLSPGAYQVHITAVGFAGTELKLTAGSGENVAVTLREESMQLDDVVVTAQKEEENLQEVPFSTTALSAKQVQAYRMWNADAVTAVVPNLYSANPGDNRNVTSLRGITSTSYDPAVATYIDGVNQFSLDTYIAQLFDVERIEVLRGPQGTLYGRNAMGGVIHIHTRQPTNRTEGFAEATVGSYGQQRFSLGVRTPLVKNKLFLGIAGLYDRADGFYTNLFTNDDFDKRNSFTGNYYLTYLVNPQWSLTLNVKNHAHRNDGAFPLAYERVYEVNQNALTTLIDNSLNGSLLASFAGASFNFTAQTTYQSNHRYYDDPIDGDFSPIDGITIINNYGKDWNNVKVFTQEFKFSSPAAAGSRVDWTGGVYLFHQDNPVRQATRFGEDAAFVGADDTNFSIINTSQGTARGAALYGQATFHLTEKLDLTAGARFDYEKKEQQAMAEYQKDPIPEPLFPILPDTTATASFQAFSPKVSLMYHVRPETHAYVVYSRGYRAGGLTQLSADPSQAPLFEYKPEYSNNIEAGIKNTFLDQRLQLNAAVFYVKVNDAQVPTLVLPDAITVTRNAGELTSEGFELEVMANLVKGLRADYRFGYTNARYSTLRVPQDGEEVDLEGNKQIFTPEITSMLAVQHEAPLGAARSLRLITRIEWMHLGTQYFDLANNIRQDPYSLFNVRAGMAGKKWEAVFWGRNLGDEQYIAYAYDFGAIHLGEPFNWGITVATRF